MSRIKLKSFALAWGVVLATVSVFAVLAMALGSTRDDYERNREGRTVAVAVSCAAIKSLVEGGATILAASAMLPGDRSEGELGSEGFKVVSGEQSLFLESKGLPGPEARVRQATKAAMAYRLDTTAGIVAASGVDLAGPDGKIDCRKLRDATLTDGSPP